MKRLFCENYCVEKKWESKIIVRLSDKKIEDNIFEF